MDSEDSLVTDAEISPSSMPERLKYLIAALVGLAMAPALATVFLEAPPRVLGAWWMQLVLATLLGVAMSISFWAGMFAGTAGPAVAAIGLGSMALAVSNYYADLWPVSSQLILNSADVAGYLLHYASYWLALTTALAVGFFAVRQYWAAVRRVENSERLDAEAGRFSSRPIWALGCLLVAYWVLELCAATENVSLLWNMVANNVSTVVGFAGIGLAGAWAALSGGRVGWRIGLAATASAAMSILHWTAFRFEDTPYFENGFGLILIGLNVLQLAIFVLSLLVIRSCGYRLVPLERAGARMVSEANGSSAST